MSKLPASEEAKQRVLKVHPGAVVQRGTLSNVFALRRVAGGELLADSSFSEGDAWLEAASRLPALSEDGIGSDDGMEMARSGAVIRKMRNSDLTFVDWGNVKFSTTLQGLSDLAHDLGLFIAREQRGKL